MLDAATVRSVHLFQRGGWNSKYVEILLDKECQTEMFLFHWILNGIDLEWNFLECLI